MKLSSFPFTFALALAAGCATQSLDDVSSDPTPTDSTSSSTPAEGSHGRIKIRRGDGTVHDVEYTVHQGHMFWQGDIDLGPAPRPGVRALEIVGMDHRWPDGIIDFRFDAAFSDTTKANIRAAIAELQRLTPLRFHEGLEAGRPYISFQFSTTTNVSYTTGIGPDGTGDGAETNVNIWPTHPPSVIIHELGHAIGLDHEAERQDRDQFVDFDSSCSTDDSQFSIDGSSYQSMTDYDLTSIMHYASWSFCEPAPSTSFGVGGTGCACFPLVLKGTSHTSMTGFIPAPTKLSPGDIRTITRMYEPRLANNVNGDKYGTASVTGDFNHDGFLDLAVGVPGKTSLQGAVDLYMGTEGGLTAWKTITAAGVTTPMGGDQFGYSLAAGDVNGDGIDDLIVGAPGRNGVAIATGAVFVFPGSDAGPVQTNGRQMTQSLFGGTDTFGDAYGTAMAVADFDGDGKNELVISAPSKATGASSVRSGEIFIYKQSGGSFVQWKTAIEPGTTAAGDAFGRALAVDDFDDDGLPDLAVGAPASSKPGAVYLFWDVNANIAHVSTLVDGSTGADAPVNGEKFGAALASGHFDRAKFPSGHLMNELAIGAPGKDNPTDSGRVYVFKSVYDPNWGIWLGLSQAKYFGQHSVPNTDNLAGDTFGSSLAVSDFDKDGFDDLAVGVPLKDMSGKTDAGATEIFRGSASAILTGAVMYGQSAWSTTSANDRFGSSVVTGDFNRDGADELIAGAPNHLNSMFLINNGFTAGAIDVFPGMGQGSLPLSLSGFFDQTVFSPE